MMPPKKGMSKVLAEWLGKASKDLAVAERLSLDDVPFCDAITFHCQQAAEKYLKALLVFNDIEFPKTHDLEILLNLVATTNSDLAGSLRDVIVLTPYTQPD